MRRLGTLAATVLALALTASGCASGGTTSTGAPAPATSPTAEASGASDQTVTLYSGRNEKLIQPVLDAFTEQTGITVEVRYGDTAQLAAQLLEEGARTRAHVFLAQDAGALGAIAKDDLFRALPEATLNLVPETYRDPEGAWVGVTGRSRVLAYKSDKVTEAELPASVFDLVEPEWKGRVGVAPTNASFQAFITAMRVQHGDERTAEFLRGLAANDPQIREKNGIILTDIEEGRVDVGLINHYYLFEKAKERGVPADELTTKLHFFGHGDTGGLVNVSGVGLLAEQPDADGQALVDYLLSTDGQTYFAEETGEYPMASGVPAPAGLPALDSLDGPKINLSDLDELDRTIEMIKEAGLL